jgi:NADPH:quinone reductase-like Zn-dependent oxidoreductase
MTSPIPDVMRAVLLTGHGGVDMLRCRDDVVVPRPGPGEVLIRVAAAGVNNTDINTRIGWYAKSDDDVDGGRGGWAGALRFPRIQGADCCGHVVAVGPGALDDRIGERVIVATMQQSPTGEPFTTITLGSEMDGAFAEYLVARSSETHAVRCDWTDVELASIPCATSTAENMLRRARVSAGERVLITGASGGVGTAAIQLARRRGAHVVAVASAAKAAALHDLGAHEVVRRDDDLVDTLGVASIDVVVDVVGGPGWPRLLDALRRGGRYVASGAIAGPLVELDLRTLYLNDLTLLGATYQESDLFDDLVRYIESGEIRPLVHATYPLERIADAQADFVAKDHIGKLVLTVA